MSDDPYLYVRQARPDLYQEIVAFSSTVNLRDELQARVSIEKFCMHLVDACKYALAILLSLLFTGVVEAKEVVIQYDDFLKMLASKEHSDKLKNQCAAERAILLKLKDEQGKTISIQADQVKGLIETAETQERLGATEAQINEVLQKQLAKVTADLDREKRLSRYKSETVWVGVAGAIFLWVVN